jgi:hypothetical protein
VEQITEKNVCEERRSIKKKEAGKEIHTCNKKEKGYLDVTSCIGKVF